jgi:hypothetical protein
MLRQEFLGNGTGVQGLGFKVQKDEHPTSNIERPTSNEKTNELLETKGIRLKEYLSPAAIEAQSTQGDK